MRNNVGGIPELLVHGIYMIPINISKIHEPVSMVSDHPETLILELKKNDNHNS